MIEEYSQMVKAIMFYYVMNRYANQTQQKDNIDKRVVLKVSLEQKVVLEPVMLKEQDMVLGQHGAAVFVNANVHGKMIITYGIIVNRA